MLIWPSFYARGSFIFYLDHGSSNWAGIYSAEIPYLPSSLIINDACLTCSSVDGASFCNRALRKGAMAHYGAVSVSTVDKIYSEPIEGIYRENLTIGQAFSKYYISKLSAGMTILSGDPTFKMNPPYLIGEKLPWGVLSI